MRRGLIFLLIISLLLVGQAAQAKEKKEDVKEWKTITRVSEKQATYSLVQHEETEELYFVKEKGNKGKKEEQYQSFLGTYEGRVQAKIMNKKEKVVLILSDGKQFSFMTVEEESGEVTKKKKLPVKKTGKRKGSQKKTRSASLETQQMFAAADSLELPSKFIVTNVTPTSVQLKWSEVEGAEKYRIRVDFDEVETIAVEETEGTEMTIDNLIPGEGYAFYFQAVGRDAESEEMMAGVILPEVMENISIQAAPTRISWNWSELEDTSRYELILMDLEDWSEPVSLEETHYTFHDLQPGEYYGVLLDVMDGPYSHELAVAVFYTPTRETSEEDDEEIVDFPDPPDPKGNLPAPENFTVEPLQTGAYLEWDRVSNAIGYELWINGEEKIELGKVTSYELKGLEPYSPYELHLRAVDMHERDGKSSVVFFYTLPDKLDPPDVRVDSVTSVSAYLKWKPVKAAKTYTIIYNGSFQTLQDEDVKVTGLHQQQTYVFTIVAENGSVKSKPAEVVVETLPPSIQYVYDGSLLKKVIDSREQSWEYKYDKNGNVTKTTYSSDSQWDGQEFDIQNRER